MRAGVDGPQHAAGDERRRVGGGEECVRGGVFPSVHELSELYGEYPIVQGEAEVPERAEAEAGGLDEETGGAERDNGAEEQHLQR